MTALWTGFDLLLVGTILWLAWASLASQDGFRMIVLFIVMGLLVALAWVRLRAPDVALAEAAIGAGLTGALFLRTWRGLQRRPRTGPPAPAAAEPSGGSATARRAVGVGVALVAAALGAALLALPRPAPSLLALVNERLSESGVTNPVTAVLLNFRGYDTLLEVVVLFAAVVCVWLARLEPEPGLGRRLGPVFAAFARIALPALVALAAYLLWLGAFAPGGAFQGAAVLAAGGLLVLLGRLRPVPPDGLGVRLLLASGPAVFAGAAVAAMALGGDLLEYPPGQAKTWILVVEAILTLSIAATLVALFAGGAPRPLDGRREGGGR